VNYTEVSFCCLQLQEYPQETCYLSDIVSCSYLNSLSALLKWLWASNTSKCSFWVAWYIIKCSHGNDRSFFPTRSMEVDRCTLYQPTYATTYAHTHREKKRIKVWILDRMCACQRHSEKVCLLLWIQSEFKSLLQQPHHCLSWLSQRHGESFITSPSAKDMSHLFHTALSWMEYNGSQPNPAYQMQSKY